ncbi:hypothetical protein [Pseudonocardia sp. DLS-67]
MPAGPARAAARDWVERHAAPEPWFRGAYLAGSAVDRPAEAEQPPWSDVDVTVVAGPAAPPKPGKIRHAGALLDVSYLPEELLADPDRVAATHYLAPSFAGPDGILLDPTGLLARLRAAIAPAYGSPAAVRRRVGDVVTAIRMRLSALDDTASWAQQVQAWLFPSTLVTVAVLVAAAQRPTVRLRFLRARDVLHDRPAGYARMLDLLGCAGVDAAVVVRHLDRLGEVFDEAAAVGRTPFFFSSDISAEARPIAIDGSRALVDAGDHREAVFWVVATFARCQQILDADAPPERARAGEGAFRAALAELTGVRGPDDLRARSAATIALLPELEDVAATIACSRQTK